MGGVRETYLYDRIEVHIDYFIQVLRDHFSDLVQSLEIVRAVRLVHEGGQV